MYQKRSIKVSDMGAINIEESRMFGYLCKIIIQKRILDIVPNLK